MTGLYEDYEIIWTWNIFDKTISLLLWHSFLNFPVKTLLKYEALEAMYNCINMFLVHNETHSPVVKIVLAWKPWKIRRTYKVRSLQCTPCNRDQESCTCNQGFLEKWTVKLIWISAEPKGRDLAKNVTNNICSDCPKKVLDKISLLHLA